MVVNKIKENVIGMAASSSQTNEISNDEQEIEHVVEGDILSVNDVIHCKLLFEFDSGQVIRYKIHSPIVDQHRSIEGSFLNGTLDGRMEDIIRSKILKLIHIKDKESELAVQLSLRIICDKVRNRSWYFSNTQIDGKWAGYRVPNEYNIFEGCIRTVKSSGDEPYYTAFCRTPCIPVATGHNIDTGEYWVQLKFANIYNRPHTEWVSQEDALSRRGIMRLASRGINLIEKNSSTMNEYLSSCLMVNGPEMPRRFVTEKNGWKCENTIFAFGNRGFSNGEVLDIVPLMKEAYEGLKVSGDIQAWIDAVNPIIHLPLVRFKMYAVFTAPLLRLLNIQSFILDHYGESSIGKTFTNDLAMSMIGDADTLRFNGDTTKTAAEILAQMYTDLPLYLDETGTQQSEDVLKALVYMLANEQGRMRGHKEGGLRETGKWKTVALTTGERPLTSHKSFSGQQVRSIEIRGGLTQDVIENIKHAADIRKDHFGHFTEPYFRKLYEYMPKLEMMYKMARERYVTKDNVKTNRMAGTFATILVAGMLLEDIFSETGIEPIEPHKIIDHFFIRCVKENPIENYSIRALHTVMDWVQSKNMCFYDFEKPHNNNKFHEFYGWIDTEYIDIIPSELRKVMERSGFDSTRTKNDWIDEGIVIVNQGRKDYKVCHNGIHKKVIRFSRRRINEILFC
ncbi:DUF927 domain-containing protein [Methanosalsum natronophilum]|uniref:DUF927 domain-containing protein n=1 Tax=Methanosalsum natronophilum TaxID=768733 RepID=UPI002167580D|nr:DUF927 domain-containing protein [Methanosalsum natronophilum]MCS3923874.1 uncharacterized protein (DUF927 family) [Methanosalsum natronophilum]